MQTFFEVYKKQLVIIVLVVAAVATGSYVTTANHKQKETEASTALAMVQVKLQETVPSGQLSEPKPDDLFKVASDYPDTRAGEFAFLRGAVTLFESGKYADAQHKFEEFSTTYPESLAKGAAQLGVAACLESQKQLDQAAAAYQGVASSFVGQPIATQARLGEASVMEQKGQFAQALKIYNEISELKQGNAFSAWSSEAMRRKERLEAAHPELVVKVEKPAKTPVVAAPAAPAKK